LQRANADAVAGSLARQRFQLTEDLVEIGRLLLRERAVGEPRAGWWLSRDRVEPGRVTVGSSIGLERSEATNRP
jgi:hypothetical protein